MKRYLLLPAGILLTSLLQAQITLLNEDFGPSSTAAQNQSADLYDLDPVATYLSGEIVTINNYGSTSEGMYESASGENFLLLTNNWNDPATIITWANMNVSPYSGLTGIRFGCSFSGGANTAWLGDWMFSMQYSFDDVANDPGSATWNNIDLSGATGWPDPAVAGSDYWSVVTVPVNGVNLNGVDHLSFRIKSNSVADYHFDDLKLEVKTPSSGQERTEIAKETFGGVFYRGPASSFTGYTNGGKMTFGTDTAHYQNYGDNISNTYPGNSNDGNWWITDASKNEDTLVFTVDTRDYADVNLQFGFTYWGGIPGTMLGVSYTTDSLEWFPVTTVDHSTPYPGINLKRIQDGYFNLIKYADILPRVPELTLRIWQATDGQAIIDDITLTGVYNPVNTDASLSAINFPEDGSLTLIPVFSSQITAYRCMLPAGSRIPPVITATPSDPDADYVVEDALDVTSEDAADRMSFITVTASDGIAQKIYAVEFYIPSGDATLSGITASIPGQTLPLSPEFNSKVTAYTCDLPAGILIVPLVQFSLNDGNAIVWVQEATNVLSDLAGDRTTLIAVTAEDGITQIIYSVVFNATSDGIDEQEAASLKAYPNPSDGLLNLESGVEITSVRIYNGQGRECGIFYFGRNRGSIDMSRMDPGLYILRVFLGDGQCRTVKVVL